MDELKFEVTKWQLGIIDTNLDDIETAINNSLKKYKGLVIQESDIPDMKKAKADMNKLSNEINKWRIQKEKEFMKPFQDKKDQCNRIVSTIKETSGEIDSQIKKFDQKEKDAKKQQIAVFWNEVKPKELEIPLELVWNDRFLLKTYSEKKWKEELKAKSESISSDLNAITNMIMSNPEEGSFVAEEYRKTMDLSGSISKWTDHVDEQRRIEQMKAEADARNAEREERLKAQHEEQTVQQPITVEDEAPVIYWAEFRVQNATLDQMKALTVAMNQLGIEFHILKNPDGTPRKGNTANK